MSELSEVLGAKAEIAFLRREYLWGEVQRLARSGDQGTREERAAARFHALVADQEVKIALAHLRAAGVEEGNMSKAQSEKLAELEREGWQRVPAVSRGLLGGPTPVESPDGKQWLVLPDGELTPNRGGDHDQEDERSDDLASS